MQKCELNGSKHWRLVGVNEIDDAGSQERTWHLEERWKHFVSVVAIN